MQPFNRFLGIALLAIAVGLVHPFVLHAQEDRLDKPIRLKVTNKRLDKVLEQLSREENISFSYNSGILRKDRLVTVTIRESTLRQALALVLGNEYVFGEMDNYIIVRKKGLTKEPFQKYGWVGKEPISKKERFAEKPFKVQVVPKAYKVGTHPSAKLALRPNNSPELEASKLVMRNIIDDLVKEKIITDRDHLEWVGLDNSQFVVNAKAVSDSLYTIFKTRYLKPDGFGYYYGPVRITGRGVFFGKNDLWP